MAASTSPNWKPPHPVELLAEPLFAVGFLLARPRLLLYAILPIVLNILAFLLVSYLLNAYLGGWVVGMIDFETGWLDATLEWISRVLLFLVFLVLSGLISFLLIIPLSAPFADMISESIEHEMFRERPDLIVPSQPLVAGAWHALLDALRRVLFVLPLTVLVFLTGLVPFIGAPIALVAGYIINSMFLALDAYSYSLDRRYVTFPRKWKFLSNNREIWLPLGFGLALLLVIPCNLVFLPFISATAGTRMYCRRLLANPPRQTNLAQSRAAGEASTDPENPGASPSAGGPP